MIICRSQNLSLRFPTSSDIIQALQPQGLAKRLEISYLQRREIAYSHSENKSTVPICVFVFAYELIGFPHDVAYL